MTESGTQPQETFVEIFARQFGFDRAQCLTPEFPFVDVEGGTRYVDFALRAGAVSFAFEIDGLQWHHPDALSIPDYEDSLLRQNSLVHQGWRVLRWTDRQVAQEPDRVRDQLALFLEGCHGFSGMEDFLPKQSGRTIQLRDYQEDALAELKRLRDEGGTIALLVHPTGSGKTTTAIMDSKSVGGRTLFLAHRDGLVRQAQREFRKLWPERRCGLFLGGDAVNPPRGFTETALQSTFKSWTHRPEFTAHLSAPQSGKRSNTFHRWDSWVLWPTGLSSRERSIASSPLGPGRRSRRPKGPRTHAETASLGERPDADGVLLRADGARWAVLPPRLRAPTDP